MNQFTKHPIIQTSKEEQTLDLKTLFLRLIKDWWVFLLCIAICFLPIFLFLRYKTPMYKINAELMVQDEKKGGSGIDAGQLLGDLSGLLSTKSNVNNEAEILKTRGLMERVVKALHLNIRYFRLGTFKDLELETSPFIVEMIKANDTIQENSFNVLFSEKNKNAFELSYADKHTKEKISLTLNFGDTTNVKDIGTFKIIKNPTLERTAQKYIFKITSVDERVAALQKALNVSVTSKLVTTIDLQLDYSLTQKGEEILYKIIEEYIKQNINDKNSIADSTISFIENRLTIVGGELSGIEGTIQNFKQGNKLADISEQSKILVANTSDYMKRLAELETQINIARTLEEYLKDGEKNKKMIPASVFPEDIVFGKLVENYNALLMERDRQLLTSTENNPYIKNLDERIISLRNGMISNLSGTKKAMEINLNRLQKEINQLDKNILQVPAQERIYLDLARQQQIKQELYLFLLKKREEMAISKTSTISNSRVIDFPKSELIPYSPNKRLIFILGLLAVIILPIARIYILDLFNNRIQSKEDIIKYTKTPIIGEISHSDNGSAFVISSATRSIIAEQFRAMRTNLYFFLKQEKGNVLLMTSSMSGEGKSFTALNLGSILAISGKKVLLMELDLRKPSLSAGLQIENNFGFTNYIMSEKTNPSDIIFPAGTIENLFILPSGPLPPNPAETIMNERMTLLMQQLKEKFDYIIIDAPPIGLVTDAQLLYQFASLTLYVVRQQYTYKEQLLIPEDLYTNGKMSKMAIVINDTKTSNLSGYNYGYDYTKEKKKNWLSKIKISYR